MAIDRSSSNDFGRPLRRLLLAVIVLVLAGIFLLWRIDSPRVERFRAQITDRIVPNLDWAMAPVTGTVNLFRDFQSYQRLTVQNQELRSELRKRRSRGRTQISAACCSHAYARTRRNENAPNSARQ